MTLPKGEGYSWKHSGYFDGERKKLTDSHRKRGIKLCIPYVLTIDSSTNVSWDLGLNFSIAVRNEASRGLWITEVLGPPVSQTAYVKEAQKIQ